MERAAHPEKKVAKNKSKGKILQFGLESEWQGSLNLFSEKPLRKASKSDFNGNWALTTDVDQPRKNSTIKNKIPKSWEPGRVPESKTSIIMNACDESLSNNLEIVKESRQSLVDSIKEGKTKYKGAYLSGVYETSKRGKRDLYFMWAVNKDGPDATCRTQLTVSREDKNLDNYINIQTKPHGRKKKAAPEKDDINQLKTQLLQCEIPDTLHDVGTSQEEYFVRMGIIKDWANICRLLTQKILDVIVANVLYYQTKKGDKDQRSDINLITKASLISMIRKSAKSFAEDFNEGKRYRKLTGININANHPYDIFDTLDNTTIEIMPVLNVLNDVDRDPFATFKDILNGLKPKEYFPLKEDASFYSSLESERTILLNELETQGGLESSEKDDEYYNPVEIRHSEKLILGCNSRFDDTLKKLGPYLFERAPNQASPLKQKTKYQAMPENKAKKDLKKGFADEEEVKESENQGSDVSRAEALCGDDSLHSDVGSVSSRS